MGLEIKMETYLLKTKLAETESSVLPVSCDFTKKGILKPL
jgi:hypothetical protein